MLTLIKNMFTQPSAIMTLKIVFNYMMNYSKEQLLKSINKNIAIILVFGVTFFSTFYLFNLTPVEASTIQNEKLIERISKDYTNKFCNSLAFGLSKESAIEFSNKENNLIFENKKGFKSLNKELIANKIATSIMEDCGYLIAMKGDNEVKSFVEDYLSMNHYNSQEE